MKAPFTIKNRLLRSLIAQFDKHEKYDGIPVSSYFASLGDQSKNPEEKCFCTTPETCLKKGILRASKSLLRHHICIQIDVELQG